MGMTDVWEKYDSEKWIGVFPGFYRQNMHTIETDTPEEAIAYMIDSANGDKTLYEESVLFPPSTGRSLSEAMEMYGIDEKTTVSSFRAR